MKIFVNLAMFINKNRKIELSASVQDIKSFLV